VTKAIVLIILSVALLALIVVVTVDNLITRFRVRENQKAWDEFSQNMTFRERTDIYLEWVEMRKKEKGWKYYYFPCIHLKGEQK